MCQSDIGSFLLKGLTTQTFLYNTETYTYYFYVKKGM